MSQDLILKRIEPIIRDLFEDYDGPVTGELNAMSIEQWDSLANIQIVVMVEKEFGLKFTTPEITELKKLGDLTDLIILKSKA
jgi:acyl carrier protein